LGHFGADALSAGKGFAVAQGDGLGEGRGGKSGEQAKCGFGADAANSDKLFEALQFLGVMEGIQIHRILSNGEVSTHGGGLPGLSDSA
jgi:hypothetical protein